jgi:hypothetical protein
MKELVEMLRVLNGSKDQPEEIIRQTTIKAMNKVVIDKVDLTSDQDSGRKQ